MARRDDPERKRMRDAHRGTAAWRLWGPYLSERQWGTVREDYSPGGDAWNYLTHDQARSRAYRWGEDGLAGFSDDHQRLCFALALWNEADPILKERLFGLTNTEGNHGEDVKEVYYYLDALPSHAYMRWLYKYPQRAYPYTDLVATNRDRDRRSFEYELVDTGVFDEDRYFDVGVEYAKAAPEDLLIRVTVHNRGPEPAPLHLLPTLWFRNTWSWGAEEGPRPVLAREEGVGGVSVLASHPALGAYRLVADATSPFVFTENETNTARLGGDGDGRTYVKDAFHRYVVAGETDAVNPASRGTKAALHHRVVIPPGGEAHLDLRLARADRMSGGEAFGAGFEQVLSDRRNEADAFYAGLLPQGMSEDQGRVVRQALSGMLWTKQYYQLDVSRWLGEHGLDPSTPWQGPATRNRDWFHMVNDDVISMPDKWEYPWYAAWDLAFHTVALAMVDLEFAKEQLALMLRGLYLHPNGQIPAYEWNFADVNPPVHAWATYFVYQVERDLYGHRDTDFLRSCFHKLMLNFTWWVNRKDPEGHNVFEGGFLGLDNIGVFDRSAPLPTGGHLEQSDGTAWMAFYCQAMLQMALELAGEDPIYEDLALKFGEHFFWIASSMDRIGTHQDEMWDEEDGFFYDILRHPDGSGQRLKVRSIVGLLPLAAVTLLTREHRERFPELTERARAFLRHHPEAVRTLADPTRPGHRDRRLLAILDEGKLRRVLTRMLDEDEFLSPYGIRSLSKAHDTAPYTFSVHGEAYTVRYLPAESDSGMFGGNSNWRGPVWFPMNALLIRALLSYYAYYGDGFRVACPTGSGRELTLFEVAQDLSDRLSRLFLRDASGRRPVFGGSIRYQEDPHWRDHLLFYEYFHGDNGAGLGASHQTGWTGLVAPLMLLFGRLRPEDVLERGSLVGAEVPGAPARRRVPSDRRPPPPPTV